MTDPGVWRKSSYSGSGDGNACVEVATAPTHISIRDSKDPARTPLAVGPAAFTAFLAALTPGTTAEATPR
ncbi:DUF397 domain-containing protein [Streptomyces sp. NPDC052225]|uniref:DUF397 domain-containing protein n=1 Tax=Streptomyces sp. NPDC052225 TaxID=3154949 RepID=UPI00341A4A3F